MSVLFHLGHPAHFHLFKHVIKRLKDDDCRVHILIKEKDVLEDLLKDAGFEYQNILQQGKSEGKWGEIKDLVIRGRNMIAYCKKHKPKLLIGTSADISYVGKYLDIPAINVNEDDAHVVPKYAWISYPWATKIISPVSCDNGRWAKKTIAYNGFHELAYLHPDHFDAEKKIVSKYTDPDSTFFMLRFADLNAHHDSGIRGIGNELANELIRFLNPLGRVFITSERPLIKNFEQYRLHINAADIHHLIAFSSLVIGDSQTMSAEAGVLGTPFIRYNDFVGKIGYLNELEETYKLGFGVQPDHPEELLRIANELASADSRDLYKKRRERMLKEKINVADFLYEQIQAYLKA